MKNTINPRIFQSLIGGASLAVPILIAGIIVAVFMGSAYDRVYIVFLIGLMSVVGMGVYIGNSGIMSFGHLSFMALGAYISGILTLSVNLKKMSLPMLPDFLKGIEIGLIPSIIIVIAMVIGFAWLSGKMLSRLEG